MLWGCRAATLARSIAGKGAGGLGASSWELVWLRLRELLFSPSLPQFEAAGHVQVVSGSVCVPGRYWETVERLKINQFYGAPTAIRLLLRYGDEWVKKYDRSSLRVLGSGDCWWHGLGWQEVEKPPSLGVAL